MEYELLRVAKANRVAMCRIYNPPLNMLNAKMMEELSQLVQELEADDDVRVVAFASGVPNVFITHYDVSELVALSGAMPEPPPEMPRAVDMPHYQLHLRMRSMPKPIIAAINGTCQGGGCEFTLACDFRVMAKGDFGIGLPEVGVGILPGGSGTQLLTRLLGPAKALEMMLFGKVVDAEEAERIGLVHKAVPAIELMPTVLTMAYRLAAGAPIAQGLIKKCVYQGGPLPLEEGLQVEMESFMQTLQTEDAREAMKAYLNWQLYEFKGR